MSRASLSLAGFQVTLIGRFWVTAEEPGTKPCAFIATDLIGSAIDSRPLQTGFNLRIDKTH
jgi:hypothetical protein